jgi:hypothetical protein
MDGDKHRPLRRPLGASQPLVTRFGRDKRRSARPGGRFGRPGPPPDEREPQSGEPGQPQPDEES